MYRSINGTWTVVEAKSSDITGRSQFTYFPNIEYRFFLSYNGYDDKIFYLNPIIYESYTIRLDKIISIVTDLDYFGVEVQFYPKTFYDNQTNNFTWIIQSPSGLLTSYNLSLSYPNGTYYASGSNANGGEFATTFNLSGTNYNDYVNMTYCYKSSISSLSNCFSYQYRIIGSMVEGSFLSNKDNTYGLSLLSRMLFAVIVVFIIAGIISFFSNGIVGGLTGLLLWGFFVGIGFLPLWSVALSLVLGVIFLLWRTD